MADQRPDRGAERRVDNGGDEHHAGRIGRTSTVRGRRNRTKADADHSANERTPIGPAALYGDGTNVLRRY